MPKRATSTSFVTKHGGWSKHRGTYQCWQDMKQRCTNPRNHNFKNYGGRGITYCDRWATFENFLADMGPRPEGLTLERINNNSNYGPDNCKWANRTEQRRNQRTCVYIEHNGRRMTVTEWGMEISIHPTTIKARINNGWPIEDVLSPAKFHPSRKLKQAARKP